MQTNSLVTSMLSAVTVSSL